MAKVVPLSKEKHSDIKLVESRDFSRFKQSHLIPVIPQDIPRLSSEFPIVFVKDSDTGQFVAVALMGLQEGKNLYCQDTTWEAQVVPSSFTLAPLTVARTEDNADNLVICIDEESELVSQDQGEPLFDDKGEQTEYLQNRIKSVVFVTEQMQNMKVITEYFAKKKLLVSKQLTVQHGKGKSPVKIDGVYTLDEEALNNLPDDEFSEIRKKGLLPLVYAHLLSLGQISRLTTKQFK
ncbi:multidrug transporter [Alteromonas sediminis]|uniref:Multidrug transporter n=1 Tax=Alteromonas sediminis TaxID=2259342 RepID=A0A3N5Y254_9ALTE|nr:SapC family protein [Alteromonas sediminis]RPJ67033.1 multidrug transporter [Alteromonas sediminis]